MAAAKAEMASKDVEMAAVKAEMALAQDALRR
jgi:hypothetical protein